jgi:hypothetical protein
VCPIWAPQNVLLAATPHTGWQQYDSKFDNGKFLMRAYSQATSALSVPLRLGKWDNKLYSYAPISSTLKLIITTINIVAGVYDVDIQLAFPPTDYSESGREQIKVITGTTSGGTVTISTNTSDLLNSWYRIAQVSVSVVGDMPGTVYCESYIGTNVVGATSVTMMLPFMENPGLDDLKGPLEMMRTNAAALLMSNSGPPLYRNGTLRAARLYAGPDVDPFDMNGANTAITQVNEKLFHDGKCENGFYTFLSPTASSLRWSDYTSTLDATDIIVYDLTDFQTVNYMSANATPDNGGLRFQVELALHLESVTSSKVYNLAEPWVDQTDFNRVVVSSSAIKPFSDNPLHPVLFGFGKRLLRAVLPFARAYSHRGVDYLADRISDVL